MRQGICDICRRPRWVNVVTVRGDLAGERCEDCFDKLTHDEPGIGVRQERSSGPNHNDPGFDNAIRALEEDR